MHLKYNLNLFTVAKCDILIGALGGIRTPDIQIRSLTLYPAELQAHNGYLSLMAEGVGFEPTDPLRSHRFSRPGP